LALQDSGQSLPELVIVPARPGAGGPEMETRYTPNRLQVVLPVFSSVASLVAQLGHEQPWVCVSLAEARRVAADMGLARVVIDPAEKQETHGDGEVS
jgi:hypothetical protein